MATPKKPKSQHKKAGRPPKKLTLAFREFCRKVINEPEVLERLRQEALTNPMFALKLAEHGIGRPFQALHIKADVETTDHRIREVQLHDGSPAFTETPGVPEFGPN